ncbi:MAG: LysR family transcriptional regulator [Rhodobacteraceae bacterium]|nr:LysR family transcriptional regulator [Paracoccaceae bacterium]
MLAPNPNPARTVRLRIRLVLGEGQALGPGKADLLEQIDALGSIAAAGRAMGMSYKRAWSLVEVMNTTFAAPLVESSRGGAGRGGARLTGTGRIVLECYRRIEDRAAEAAYADFDILAALLPETENG